MTSSTKAPPRKSGSSGPSKVKNKTKSKPGTSLRSGRPPLLSSRSIPSGSSQPSNGQKLHASPASRASKSSSKATRALINAHHNLHKARAKAIAAGEADLTAQIDHQIAQLGGLNAYQHASLTGQSADRGGDSSTVLVKWLEELTDPPRSGPRLRVLEVGALSSRNAISKAVGRRKVPSTSSFANNNESKQDIKNESVLIESVRRIDLKSQEPGLIEEIDFMQLPLLPEQDRYDVLSLSLVLNYVPDTRGRGEMLKRTREFLRYGGSDDIMDIGEMPWLPCLFVVLPLPCLTNSRYLDGRRFREIMASLGYSSLRVHQSAKLHYELFQWDGKTLEVKRDFKKLEVNPGKGRNNFCIVLDGS